jgi:hypothetical protein
MQIIKKIIGFITIILSVIIVFILVNLLIGGLKFWSFSGYFNMLEDKNWDSVSEDITWNPVSRIWIFYDDTDDSQTQIDSTSEELLNNLDELLPRDENLPRPTEDDLDDISLEEPTFQIWDTQIVESWENYDNPYDPDFEDEFNSFFAGE